MGVEERNMLLAIAGGGVRSERTREMMMIQNRYSTPTTVTPSHDHSTNIVHIGMGWSIGWKDEEAL